MFYSIAIVNLILALIRYASIKKNKLLLIDPILAYHSIWTINFFLRALNLTPEDVQLNSMVGLFIGYWSAVTIGLWLGVFLLKYNNCSVLKQHDIKSNNCCYSPEQSEKVWRSYKCVSVIINIICFMLAVWVIIAGYPIGALFKERTMASSTADYKQIVAITFLGAFIFVYSVSIMKRIHNLDSRRLIFLILQAMFPMILIMGFTAGRTAVVVTIILIFFVYMNVNMICKITSENLRKLIYILIICIVIFVGQGISRGTVGIKNGLLQLNYYFTGPMDCFESHSLFAMPYLQGYPGYRTFMFLFMQLKKIGISYGPTISPYELLNMAVNSGYSFSPTPETIFFELQVDYGSIFGLAIAFIWGIMSISIQKRYITKKSLFMLVFCSLNTFQLLWSGQMMYLFSSSQFVFYLMWALVFQNVKVNNDMR